MKVRTEFPCSIEIRDPVWIPLSSGIRLAARLCLPQDAAVHPVPALLEYSPYRRRDFSIGGLRHHRYLAGHGYAAVRVDIRGSGDSEGLLDDEYKAAHETTDGLEIIDWIARQPWCTGKVGMFGTSWAGFNSLQIAARRPPALKAIIANCASDDRYADDVHYMGGCLITENVDWSATMFAYNARPPDPAIVGDAWRSMWLERLDALTHWLEPWLTHQTRDTYWKTNSVCEDYASIECAVFATGGWADGYSNAIDRLIANLRCPRLGLIGPWGHSQAHNGVPGPAIGWLQEALRWWDYWLKDKDTGIMGEPLLRVWMQESVAPQSGYAERPGRWIGLDAPLESASSHLRYNLAPGSLTRDKAADVSLAINTQTIVGAESGDWCPYGDGAEFPGDQRGDDAYALVFESEPLVEDLELLGAVTLDLAITSNQPIAAICTRLSDVRPDGSVTRVTYGLMNLTHDPSHQQVSPLERGEERVFQVRLNDIAHRFPHGHRIRIALSPSYWPLLWPSPAPATLHIALARSSLSLPILNASLPLRPVAPFGEPEAAEAPRIVVKRPGARRYERQRDLVTGIDKVIVAKDKGVQLLPDIALEIEHCTENCFEIRHNDVLSARMTVNGITRLQRGDWRIRIDTFTSLTADARNFHVEAQMKALEGDSCVRERTFKFVIPRLGQ